MMATMTSIIAFGPKGKIERADFPMEAAENCIYHNRWMACNVDPWLPLCEEPPYQVAEDLADAGWGLEILFYENSTCYSHSMKLLSSGSCFK